MYNQTWDFLILKKKQFNGQKNILIWIEWFAFRGLFLDLDEDYCQS